MDSAVAELVLSGAFYKKTEFVIYVCQKSYPELLNYIHLFEEIRKNREGRRYKASEWLYFLKTKEEIQDMVISKQLLKEKDFWLERNEDDTEENLILSGKTFVKLLNEDSLDYVSQLKYVYEKYKYYLDNLLYLNINIHSLDGE